MVKTNILYPVPHRQYVFSIPIILRKYFLYNRKLLSELCRSAHESLLVFFRTALGKPEGVIGTVMAIQTFGDYAKWHPHIHSITADGLFDELGVFYCMPKTTDIQPLAELFRANVLKILKRKGLIDDRLIENLMKWRHTPGFSVHNGVRLARDDQKGQTAVAQYILRNPFAQGKINFNETTSMVVYKSKMTHSKGEGGKKNFAVYPACDFIAAITLRLRSGHRPTHPGKEMSDGALFRSLALLAYLAGIQTGCGGRDGNRKSWRRQTRGRPRTTKASRSWTCQTTSRAASPHPHGGSASKKFWEVDPLICPHCHAAMKIISFISEPKLVRKILEHLKLWSIPSVSERSPPARAAPLPGHDPQPKEEITYEPVPQFEEPSASLN